jgi:hypothetical protein
LRLVASCPYLLWAEIKRAPTYKQRLIGQQRRSIACELGFESGKFATKDAVVAGTAVIEITAQHMGCKKFLAGFGQDALQFISTPLGKELGWRRLNTKIFQPGFMRVGEAVKKLDKQSPEQS